MAGLKLEPVIKKFVILMVVCFFSFATLLAMNIIFEIRMDQVNHLKNNEQIKNTLSLMIQKRVLMAQNQFQGMMLASSRGALELANRDVLENLAMIETRCSSFLERNC